MAAPALDPEITRGFLRTSVPTVVDVLDYQFGLRTWMRPEIKPLAKQRIAGQAVTLRLVAAPKSSQSLDEFFAAFDACGPGQVLVVTNGGDTEISCMGDLVVTALHARGAAGAVMDGAVRDIEPMLEMGFPIFAASVSPVGFTDKQVVVDRNAPIVCGGVDVRPGDVILADWDGVVVIPQELAAVVLDKALAAEEHERAMRDRIREATPSKGLAAIFAEFE
jgi:regulator of RNase E activity RraA